MEEIKNLLETQDSSAPVDVRAFTCPECFRCTTQFFYSPPYLVTCIAPCTFAAYYSTRTARLYYLDKKRAYPSNVFVKQGAENNLPVDSGTYKESAKKE